MQALNLFRKGAEAAGTALDMLGTADAKQQALETRRRADREKARARSAPENTRQTSSAAASAGRASRDPGMQGIQGPGGGRSGAGSGGAWGAEGLEGETGLAEQVHCPKP